LMPAVNIGRVRSDRLLSTTTQIRPVGEATI